MAGSERVFSRSRRVVSLRLMRPGRKNAYFQPRDFASGQASGQFLIAGTRIKLMMDQHGIYQVGNGPHDGT